MRSTVFRFDYLHSDYDYALNGNHFSGYFMSLYKIGRHREAVWDFDRWKGLSALC